MIKRFSWFLLAALAAGSTADVDGTTELHRAAYHEDFEAAERLIRAGANVNGTNRYGVTPLSLACTAGNVRIVELLLKAGADPNAPLPGEESALMIASRTGKVDAVKALLERGANVNAKQKGGQTALMWAAAEGHAETVKALIAAGADFRARLDSGFTPLLFAVREGQAGVVRALLDAGADANDAVPLNKTPGRYSSQGRGTPRAGISALHLAVTNAHYELAAMLLAAGADPNAAGPGYTPLHVLPSVRKPGGGDNDPAPRGSGNMTSLEFLKVMKERGADFNARMTRRVGFGLTSLNTLGATPFLLAARTGDAELMRALAALGADPLIPNANRATPLIVAAGLGTRSPGEDAGTEAEVMEAVQAALDLGNDINAADDNGETAMHGAAYKNLPGVVELLAARGAKLEVWNKKNKQGWTPLIIAQGHRFGNYKPSPVTIAAFERVLTAAGITVVADKPVPTGRNSDYVR